MEGNLTVKLNDAINYFREVDGKLSGTESEEFQTKLKSVIADLEQITIAVSQLDMFSANESLEELPTANMRFLMLPALLAACTDKLKTENRRALVECVEVYIKDFVTRLKNYGILPSGSNEFNVSDNMASETPPPSRSMSPQEYLKSATKNRDDKIKLYREQKEFKEKYDAFLEKFSDGMDEDHQRGFFFTELNYWARKLYEMFCVIQKEKPILDQLAKIQCGEIKEEAVVQRSQPFKPIILTRCKLTKEVFGLGYPSIPIVSLDEFYEKQTREGNLQMLSNKDDEPYDPDAKNRAIDAARDSDDSSLVQSEREWDEYKDEHRTGWGNTYNKG